MCPIKILQVPLEVAQCENLQIDYDYLIARRNGPTELLQRDGHPVPPISCKEKDYRQFDIGQTKVCVRIYATFSEASCDELCGWFPKVADCVLIIVQCRADADRPNFLALYKKSSLNRMAILTNQNEGDISFMPLDTFQKSMWVVTNSSSATQVNDEIPLVGIKNEIFDSHINNNLICFKVTQIRELLSPTKLGTLSVSTLRARIQNKNNELKKLLDDIDSLNRLVGLSCEEKTRSAKNSYWSERSAQDKNSEFEMFSKVFLEIRKAFSTIRNERRQQDYRWQIFEHAKMVADGVTGRFEEVVEELLGSKWRNFQEANRYTKNSEMMNFLKQKIDSEIGTGNVINCPHHLVQTSDFQDILNEVNNCRIYWEKIKSVINNSSLIEKKDKLLAIAKEVLREGMKLFLEGATSKEVLREGMKQSPERAISILDTFLKEVVKLFELGETQSDLRKTVFNEIFKYDQDTAVRIHKQQCNDAMPEVLRLTVICSDDCALEIKPEEIERTFYTGKWTHGGPDYISKRMVHTYFKQPENKLLRFCNNMFREYNIPKDVEAVQLRMKCDKWRDNKLMYSFRPIAMATQLINLIDKVIYSRLLDWELNNKIIPELSFSYQKRKSAALCQFKLLQKLAELIKSDVCWYPISVDFKKAYENVNPAKLCQIMANKGVPSQIISWVWRRLRRRELQMKDGDPWYTSTGLPQGSALSPLLFNIYTAHLHDIVRNKEGFKGAFLYQYTDDLLILATDSDFNKAKRIAENICFEVIKSMNEYDAKLKSKSVDEVSFVGIKVRVPENAEMCKNLQTLFDVYFKDLTIKINKRMESLNEGIEQHPADGWTMFHTKIRPLFTKGFISLEILKKDSPDAFNNTIETVANLRSDCLKQCLGFKGDCNNYALLCESGEFPANDQMKLEYDKTYRRHEYYGYLGDKSGNQMTQISLPDNIRQVNENSEKNDEYTYIAYTDGTALKLDDDSRRSGAGVYFKKPPCMMSQDPSQRLYDDIMISTSEMVALVIALEKIKHNWLEQGKVTCKVLLCFDRDEAMSLLTKRSNRRICMYAEEFKKIAHEMKTVQIDLLKVKGHINKGNKEADKRAKKSARSDFINDHWNLSLTDTLRTIVRKAREKFDKDLKRESKNDESLQEYFNRVGSGIYEFRMKPWFQSKRVKALELSADDFRLYIKNRLSSNVNVPELKEWEYYYAGYANCKESDE